MSVLLIVLKSNAQGGGIPSPLQVRGKVVAMVRGLFRVVRNIKRATYTASTAFVLL